MTPECCSDEFEAWVGERSCYDFATGDVFVCPKCFTHYALTDDGWWTSLHGECGVDPSL